MSTFTLKIKCDNAAFDPMPCDEIVRLLLSTAARIQGGGLKNGGAGAIHDVNGNLVGGFKLSTMRRSK